MDADKVNLADLPALLKRLASEGVTRLALLGPNIDPGWISRQPWPAEARVFHLAEHLVEIPPELLALTSLIWLNLNGNRVGADGARAIAEHLKSLTSLNLGYNNVGADGARAIAEHLKSLTSLNLGYNNVGADGAQAIAEGLKSLKSLYLGHNDVGDDGAWAIATSLKSLTSLDLAHNNVGDYGAQAIAAGLMSLTSLNLRFNEIGDGGALAIAQGLKSLTWLNLAHNNIGNHGTRALKEGVPSGTLLHLNDNDPNVAWSKSLTVPEPDESEVTTPPRITPAKRKSTSAKKAKKKTAKRKATKRPRKTPDGGDPPTPPPPDEPAAPTDLRLEDDLPLNPESPEEEERQDLLGFGVYADALAGLISNERTGTPLTIAINAPWGAGKSSLANMVQSRLRRIYGLRKGEKFVTCEFNAWLHDDAPNLSAALAGAAAEAADTQRNWWHRTIKPVPDALLSQRRRTNRMRQRVCFVAVLVALVLVIVWRMSGDVLAALLAESVSDTAASIVGASSILIVYGVVRALKSAYEQIWPIAKDIASFVNDPKSAAATGSVKDVREQIGKLIAQAVGERGRFVVFIDDADRCEPPRAVDVLEVTNQLLSHENVVCLVMADMESVARHASLKYKAVADKINGEVDPGFGRRFVRKTIQLRLDLPLAEPRERLGAPTTTSTPSTDEANAKGPKALLSDYEFLATSSWLLEPERLMSLAVKRLGKRIELGKQFTALMAAMRSPFELYLNPLIRWVFPAAEFGAPDNLTEIESLHRKLRRLMLAWSLGSLMVLIIAWPMSAFLSAYVWLAAAVAIVGVTLISLYVSLNEALALRRAIRARRDATRAETEKWLSELVVSSAIPTEIHQQANERIRQLENEYERQVAEDVVREWEFSDEQALQSALSAVKKWVPKLPRRRKRLTNQLRLLLHVTRERGVLKQQPTLHSQMVGKWVLFGERWPELASEIRNRPTLLADLESKASDLRKLKPAIKKLTPFYESESDLHELLKADPPLAEFLPTLLSGSAVQDSA